MKKCEECGKKLGILEGYRHPVVGKDVLVCSNCFDTVLEKVEQYGKFLSPYVDFFKNSFSNQKYKLNPNNILTGWASIKEVFTKF
ncbi:MAG: hypothetical protein JSW06_08535 [Thermoplasmatales archaeon]|nr:MAG: hypothetical protein JSW06_08535 [Thermoplasmatales archaeon]